MINRRRLLRTLAVSLCGLMFLASPAFADRIEGLSRSMVFLIAAPLAQTSDVGSGFLLAKGNALVLVTADHVARKLNPQSVAVIGDQGGNALQIEFYKLTGSSTSIPWHYHRTADLAVVCLYPVEAIRHSLERRFLPVTVIRNDTSAPSRAITLTVLGFPLGLGGAGRFSPISRDTRAASDLLVARRFDTKTPATFFVTQDPSVGGFSGAPVFDTGLPFSSPSAAIEIDGRPAQIVGVVHGTATDETGGKFGLITPGYLVRELLPVCG